MTAPRAVIYSRISHDDKDDDRPDDKGVSRQEREARGYCEAKGYGVAGVYVDNDTGASTRSRAKSRPAWDRLLEAVKGGTVDVVVARDLDRLTRRMRELEDLVEIAEATGVRFDLLRGHLDLESASGRQMARMLAAGAAGESDRTAERVASQRRDRARRGVPVVAVEGFGWRDGLPVADEAEAIRAGALAVIGGASLASVARRWNEAGLRRRRTERGWRGQDVRGVLLNPRHRGEAVYRGATVAPLDGPRILDEATAAALLAVLEDPARSTGPRRRRTLSGVVRCGRCGATMKRGPVGSGERARAGWQCAKATGCGRVAVTAEPVEAAVSEAVLTVFDTGLPAPAGAVDAEALGAVRAIDAEAEALGSAYGAGTVPLAAFLAASRALETRRAAAVEAVAPKRAEAATAPYREPGALRAAWPALDESERNAIVRAVIDAVTVQPAPYRGWRGDPTERTEVRWRA